MAVRKVVLKNGKTRYRVRVYVGRDPDTGKQELVTKTYDKKKDADREETRLKAMKGDGILVRPSKETLAKYLKRWLREVKEGELRARTLYDYQGIVRRYIEKPPEGAPPIGKVRLDRLTPFAFQSYYDFLWREVGLSPRTLQFLHTILRQALKHAVLVGSLARNPTDGVKAKKQRVENGDGADSAGKRRAIRAMSQKEATGFLKAAREDRYYPFWAVLLTGGLRPGEALGLLWEDVDLKEGKLHVRRSLTRLGVKGWRLTEPKTDRARRVVPLPEVTARALRDWRTAQAKEKLLLGAEYEDKDFVFASEFGRPLDGANLNNRNFRAIMAEAKLGEWEMDEEGKQKRFLPAHRVYDLRHTCATLLLRAGENPKVVSERLGHASITLTLDTYSHVLPDMQEAAAEKLEVMFGKS